ncbi:MAG: hypothetical protein WCG05_00635 [Alphaproteobacteria bacterium]
MKKFLIILALGAANWTCSYGATADDGARPASAMTRSQFPSAGSPQEDVASEKPDYVQALLDGRSEPWRQAIISFLATKSKKDHEYFCKMFGTKAVGGNLQNLLDLITDLRQKSAKQVQNEYCISSLMERCSNIKASLSGCSQKHVDVIANMSLDKVADHQACIKIIQKIKDCDQDRMNEYFIECVTNLSRYDKTGKIKQEVIVALKILPEKKWKVLRKAVNEKYKEHAPEDEEDFVLSVRTQREILRVPSTDSK